jgi:hypothetical protein
VPDRTDAGVELHGFLNYPSWNVSLSLHDIFSEIVAAWRGKGNP